MERGGIDAVDNGCSLDSRDAAGASRAGGSRGSGRDQTVRRLVRANAEMLTVATRPGSMAAIQGTDSIWLLGVPAEDPIATRFRETVHRGASFAEVGRALSDGSLTAPRDVGAVHRYRDAVVFMTRGAITATVTRRDGRSIDLVPTDGAWKETSVEGLLQIALVADSQSSAPAVVHAETMVAASSIAIRLEGATLDGRRPRTTPPQHRVEEGGRSAASAPVTSAGSLVDVEARWPPPLDRHQAVELGTLLGVDLTSMVTVEVPPATPRRPSATATAPGRSRARASDTPATGKPTGLPALFLPDGTAVALRGPVVIGRNPSAKHPVDGRVPQAMTVPDPDRAVSRTHALIRVGHGATLLEDLGSANGTVVEHADGRRQPALPDAPVLLRNRCTLVLGNSVRIGYLPPT